MPASDLYTAIINCSLRPVDVDIIYKCVATQQAVAEEKKDHAHAARELNTRVAHGGVVPADFTATGKTACRLWCDCAILVSSLCLAEAGVCL